VPYLIYKSLRLTENVPGFIAKSFSYYALQIIVYVLFFSIRMIASFILQTVSVTVMMDNNDVPVHANIRIRDLQILLMTAEIIFLAFIISLGPAHFSHFIKRCLPRCLYENKHLLRLENRLERQGTNELGMVDTIENADSGERKDGKKVKFGDDHVYEHFDDDDIFKQGYSAQQLRKSSTLVLKTSFHLINYIMMSVCHVMFENEKEE
jgi:hypothetical protein